LRDESDWRRGFDLAEVGEYVAPNFLPDPSSSVAKITSTKLHRSATIHFKNEDATSQTLVKICIQVKEL